MGSASCEQPNATSTRCAESSTAAAGQQRAVSFCFFFFACAKGASQPPPPSHSRLTFSQLLTVYSPYSPQASEECLCHVHTDMHLCVMQLDDQRLDATTCDLTSGAKALILSSIRSPEIANHVAPKHCSNQCTSAEKNPEKL